MNNEIIQASMSIILNAGDARTACKEALDAMAAFDFETAKIKMKEANKKIVEAHKVQTNAITAETNGEKREYSVLFAHAQDTLMTIYSEINIAKQLLKLSEALDARIATIESKMVVSVHE